MKRRVDKSIVVQRVPVGERERINYLLKKGSEFQVDFSLLVKSIL
jgi:hypothetical protein